MRDGYGFLEAPRDVAEALMMLGTKDCYAAGLGTHRLTDEQTGYKSEAEEWVVGTCRNCLRAVLAFFPADGKLREWPFYDQTIEACQPANI